MEVSVSFTDGNRDLNAESAAKGEKPPYYTDESVLGLVWIPREGLELLPPVRIRYEKHPWIEAFEFDGVKAAPARRTGIGNKGAKGFVKSLSTIYSRAYDDYRSYGGDETFDASAYFAHAARHFTGMAQAAHTERMVSKFCGFTENMWREGDEEMLHICLDRVLPVILADETARRIFEKSITDEFRTYLRDKGPLE